MLKYLFLISVVFCTLSVKAQGFLAPETKAFFEAQEQEYYDWLKLNDLDKFLEINRLQIQANRVSLYLKNALQSDDSLGVAWGNAEQKALQEGQKLGEVLFKQFIHQFEIPADSAALIIQGRSSAMFEIKINGTKEGNIDINEKIAVAKASGTISIPITKLKIPKGHTGSAASISEEQIRQKIYDYLHNYYSKKGTQYVGKSKWEKIKNGDTQILFEVINISYEILKDVGHHEFIKWNITIEKDAGNQQFNIKYELKGKWGSGWYAPRRSDFKDMENNATYNTYLEQYQERMTNLIQEYLSK